MKTPYAPSEPWQRGVKVASKNPDWRPHDKWNVPALYEILGNVPPEVRAVADRIREAHATLDLDAAREALNCPEPKVRAMAVKAICEGKILTQDSIEVLLEFSTAENRYVSGNALREFTSSLSKSREAGVLDGDKAIDICADALRSLDPGPGDNGLPIARCELCDAIMDAVGPDSLDVDTMKKATKVFMEIAASDDMKASGLVSSVLNYISSGMFPGYNGEDLPDDETMARNLETRCKEVEEAVSYFPDDAKKSRSFMNRARPLVNGAKERFGDDEEGAAAWLADEKAYLARKLSK